MLQPGEPEDFVLGLGGGVAPESLASEGGLDRQNVVHLLDQAEETLNGFEGGGGGDGLVRRMGTKCRELDNLHMSRGGADVFVLAEDFCVGHGVFSCAWEVVECDVGILDECDDVVGRIAMIARAVSGLLYEFQKSRSSRISLLG